MLHPKITLTEQSLIHQRGLIASETIYRGEVVWKRDPDETIIPLSEVEQWSKEKQEEFIWVAYQCSPDEYILPKGIDRYMNHSCDPNTWWIDDETLVANRQIQAGEEVTYDYATSDISMDFQMECKCGSPSCRGIVSNKDHLKPEWQKKYGDHLPSYILKVVAER